MATASPNSRASLLSGLRTGGVRSTSATVPHTAAPGGSFNVPRFASQLHSSVFPEEDDDQIVDVPDQPVFANRQGHRVPMTAAVDGPDNRFAQQQHRGMNPNVAPFTPSFLPRQPVQPVQAANPALQQMQMMELLKLQALQQYQQQQFQAQLIAQAQAQALLQQQQAQQSPRRASFNPPATAGPLSSTFDLRSTTLRRAAQNSAAEDQVPMTAALGGKFGGRPSSMSGSPMSRFAVDEYDDAPGSLPPTPHSATTVISGGTSLGSLASNNVNGNVTPSKSDSASTWRRGGNNNSVLSGNNRSPSVKVTPPPAERRVSPPPVASPSPAVKSRPQPLRFSVVASQSVPAVAIDDTTEGDNEVEAEVADSSSSSNPSTPPSSSSNGTPLSPREAASKKLYEGLGIGRPVPTADQPPRLVSQPLRQPRGPPSSVDELGPKNFATRIRRQAIGGLGALMNSRERRELVEAY
ncbi:hypothetical protein MSAN_01429800 [Mycena sanguinolenta]|uniref:Uncharacterized protein n=1 Tax=Mycena sanguinolenta TaxID=230812 RepID=A0A8H6YAF7_9AGAR|nr:hypothetical protein MSAN_01429800 [Mycena sanguinolenta]